MMGSERSLLERIIADREIFRALPLAEQQAISAELASIGENPGVTFTPSSIVTSEVEGLESFLPQQWFYRDKQTGNFRMGDPFAGREDQSKKLCDRIFALSRALADAERRLKYALSAIETGRSEPLFIARDDIRNYFEDRASLSKGSTDGERAQGDPE
jgi:hypothetical protein